MICVGFLIVMHCSAPPAPVADSFCQAYENAVRHELRLTEAELRALRIETKRDLAALKGLYRKRCKPAPER